jgi:RimJ/RimL family protein N-acetyltransferase
VAYSGAWVDNVRSMRVSRRLGYEDDGFEIMDRSGQQGRQQRFRLERDRWLERRRDDILIEGLEPCLAMFGLDPAG